MKGRNTPMTEPSTLVINVSCRDRVLECGTKTLMMGIVNVTPDSFSDGGQFLQLDRAVAHGRHMAEAGADLIDVGGESTRPGSDPVTPEDEQKRVVPVIETLAREVDALISVDTRNASTARLAVAAGAHVINDVSGLRHDPAIARVAAETGAGLVLMHSRATPKDMQAHTDYTDLMSEIRASLEAAVRTAVEAGVRANQIILDPGLGFGKTMEQNYAILRSLGQLTPLGHALLVGPSRKSFIGKTLDRPPEEREWGNAAAVTAAILHGAHIVRVHHVPAMRDVCRVADAIRGARAA